MFTLDPDSTVFVVDDDRGGRETLTALVRIMGVQTKAFPTAEAFLAESVHRQPGCVIADLRMPGLSGIGMLKTMRRDGNQMPLILVTAYADVPVAVEALHEGALTILEKPYRQQVLWDYIVLALRADYDQRSKAAARGNLLDRIRDLSNEETRVLQMMVKDVPNKVIASQLQISLRTVDHRRIEILEKLRMENLKALIWHLGAAGWPMSLDCAEAINSV